MVKNCKKKKILKEDEIIQCVLKRLLFVVNVVAKEQDDLITATLF